MGIVTKNLNKTLFSKINEIRDFFTNKKESERKLNLKIKLLTPYEREVLENLDYFDSQTISDISVSTRIKPSEIKSTLNQLKEDGLVKFCDTENKSTKLTLEGKRLKNKIFSNKNIS